MDSVVVGGEKRWAGMGGTVRFTGGARDVAFPTMLWRVSPQTPTVLRPTGTGIVDVPGSDGTLHSLSMSPAV